MSRERTTGRLFRPHELAREIGCHVETVRRWIREHRIGHVHFPGCNLIPEDDYVRVIQEGAGRKNSFKHSEK